jgi:DNA-binding HxlR family transcriptional regulator
LLVGTQKWYSTLMDTKETRLELYTSECPTREALDRIANKWTTLVFGLLEDGPKRFSDLRRGIGGITQKMLTQTLRDLERDGLVSRTVYGTVPPHVEYELTALGRTLSEPIGALRQWALEHIAEVVAAQQLYDRRMARNKPTSKARVRTNPEIQ